MYIDMPIVLSCQQLVAEFHDKRMHVTTTVVDFLTLYDLPAQETRHVMIVLATPRHLPRLQLTVDELPVMVAQRPHSTMFIACRRAIVDGGRLDD